MFSKKLSFIVFFFGCLFLGKPFSCAEVYLSQTDALEMAFPGAERIERKNIFLTPEQIAKIQTLSKSKVEDSLITYYVGSSSNGMIGTAFFDTHIVRTMPETMMCVIDPNGQISMVELLAFHEPPDYRPMDAWLDTFNGKDLDDQLWVKRGLKNITGATLTTQSLSAAVRKYVALFQIINQETK